MRLTTFTDYSLRVLLYVAAAPEGRATIAEVANAYRISENHLVKVVHVLGKAGVLFNSRGRGGGFRLAGPAADINIGRVVRITECGDLPAECFDAEHNECVLAGSCRLEGVLHEALRAFYAVLDRYTLADLAVNRRQLARILRFSPRVATSRAP